MHYWRKDSFDKLASLKERLAKIPELSDYVAYTELLTKGLRKEALKHIEDLLSTLRALPKERQRVLASLLCRETENETGHRLLPDPLRRRFIIPVIDDWKSAEPSNPEPFRWTGILNDLIRAVELDSSCDHTRRRLILRILGYVGCRPHELPSSYLGAIEDDYDLLRIAAREALSLRDEKLRAGYLRLIEDERRDIDDRKNQ